MDDTLEVTTETGKHTLNTDKIRLGLSVSTLATLLFGIITFVSLAINSKRDISDQIREVTSSRDAQFREVMKAQEDKYRADNELLPFLPVTYLPFFR